MNRALGTTRDHENAEFPHETAPWSPWSPVVPGNRDHGPRVSPPKGGPPGVSTGPRGEKFAANTCPRCSSVTIAGLWVGLRVDLEPLVLDDLGEYQAIAAGIGTWNLWPDRAARPRGVSEIRAATRTDRHARHTCDRTFGTRPRTRARDVSAPTPDDPPF